jgi:hypothetical protein
MRLQERRSNRPAWALINARLRCSAVPTMIPRGEERRELLSTLWLYSFSRSHSISSIHPLSHCSYSGHHATRSVQGGCWPFLAGQRGRRTFGWALSRLDEQQALFTNRSFPRLVSSQLLDWISWVAWRPVSAHLSSLFPPFLIGFPWSLLSIGRAKFLINRGRNAQFFHRTVSAIGVQLNQRLCSLYVFADLGFPLPSSRIFLGIELDNQLFPVILDTCLPAMAVDWYHLSLTRYSPSHGEVTAWGQQRWMN